MGDWEEILLELSMSDTRHGGFICSAIKEIATLRAECENQRSGFERECKDIDLILSHLGLDMELCRTDGGGLNKGRIASYLEPMRQALKDVETLRAELKQDRLVEQQADRIKELQQKLRWQDDRDKHQGTHSDTCYTYGSRHYECAIRRITELAAQNQAMRLAAQAVIDRWDSPVWKDVPHTAEYINELRNVLDLPDLATPILNEVKAKTLEEAAEEFSKRWTQSAKVQEELRRMAAELRGK